MAGTINVSVTLQRMDDQGQARLSELMIKNNEGTITPEEQMELEDLVALYEQIMLANSEALVRATRPDLGDASGQIDLKRR